jgi:glycosyltransferase involved in cell wall biosynthesis
MEQTTIAITCWNLLPWHRRCIVRARQQVPKDKGEIIVVDQNSEDGTQFYLREALKEGLIDVLVLLPENKGAAVSRNIAVGLAKYDRVLLLDGDIIMPYNWVELANEYLDNHEKHQAISIYPALCTQNEAQYTDKLEKLNQISESYTSCTNLGVYRKSYLQAVPFPDKGIFAKPGWGFEDTIQSHIGMKQGYKWAHVYDEKIAYLHPLNSSRKLLRQLMGEQEADRRTHVRQHFLFELSKDENVYKIGGVDWNKAKLPEA